MPNHVPHQLNSQGMEKLNLTFCRLQDYDLKILQHGLRSSRITITELWLQDNDFTAVSSSAISDLIIGCRVKILDISHNNIVGEDDALYKILADHSSMLEEPYMYYTKLSSSAAIKLFDALSEAKMLKKLWISSNSIGDEACDAIVLAIKKNTSLVRMDIDDNPIGGESILLIFQALQHNNTLKLLYLNKKYPNDVKKKIESLQEEINEKRATHVRLEIKFWPQDN